MSGLGLLATAFAGGAKVVGEQAGGDIEQSRKAELMKQQADIEEQMRMRLSEFGEKQRRDGLLYDTTGEGGAAKLDLARRSGEQANDLSIKGKVAEATNPELAAAKDTQAEAELQRDIKRINATTKPEAEKAAAIAEARARADAKYRKADPTVQSKIADIEKVLNRPLTEQERLTAIGLAKTLDKDTGYETVVEKQFDAQGNETGSVTRKVPIKGGQGGREPASDPYAVPKRDAKPAPEAKPMLQSIKPAEPKYRPASDGSGRIVDVTTGRTLTPEQSAIYEKIQRGEPTSPRERALLRS